MYKYICVLLLLFLLGCSGKKTKKQVDLESFDKLSMCFTLSKGWARAENGAQEGARFAGVEIQPLKSYFHSSGSIMTLSSLGTRENADSLPLRSFADSVQIYLESKGSVEKKEYKVGGYKVVQMNLKESDKYVFKLLFKSSYTSNFMMDFIVPLSVYNKETFESVGTMVASVQMKE